jgi:hypothetical protein
MAEVLRLNGVIGSDEFRKDLTKFSIEVVQLLAAQEVASTNPRITAIIRGAEAHNGQTIANGGSLADGFGELLQESMLDNAFYLARWQEFGARYSRVDMQKIANAELGELMIRALQSMERTPDAVETLVSLAAIAQFAASFYYVDLLRVLLQYPTAYRRMLDTSGALAKAAVMDLAGTVIPFLGTITTAIDTVFDLIEPRIEKKIAEFRQATVIYDRLCDFDDQLTELLGHQDFAENLIRSAGLTLKTTRASFTADAAWVIAVLGNAEQG